MRSCEPSLLGPGISARIRALPAEPCPRIATNSTMIPRPPRKCVLERQKRMHRGTHLWFSMSVSTVAPVVLNPDWVSKRQSAIPMGISWPSTAV